MGIWARDKADQEDWAPAHLRYRPTPPPRPPQYLCEECGRSFTDPEKLRRHRFDGHTTERPALYLAGKELDRAPRTIVEQHQPIDWRVTGTISATLNGQVLGPSELPAALASTEHGVSELVLTGSKSTATYDLRFAIPNPDELDEADDEFLRLAFGDRLTVASISGLIHRLRHHRTSGDYVGGLSDYLFGVLAREGASDSGLAPHQYREKYDAAAAALASFRRPIADTIVGLITFHYNQFHEAVARTAATRVAPAARRLQALEVGQDTSGVPVQPLAEDTLDFILSDSKTEAVLRWCCVPFDDVDDATLTDIETGIRMHEPLDQRKLHLVAAECQLRRGNRNAVRAHVNELRHQGVNDRWVSTVLTALDTPTERP